MKDFGISRTACISLVVFVATAPLSPAQTLTTLHNFTLTDGSIPYASLIQATDGNLYGTTENGGINNGTVFKITSTGTFTTVHFFCTWPNCSDGSNPFAGLVQGTDGNFYGTTSDGGYEGTVFKITPAGRHLQQTGPLLHAVQNLCPT